MNDTINILVVEDSEVARQLLVHILNAAPRLRVSGTASHGEEALDFLKHHQPDVVVMDIHLPGIDGYETTRRIMESRPLPIVVCSGSQGSADVSGTFRAMEAGALALVGKPVGPGRPDYEALAAKLVDTVLLMSEVKVVRRWARRPLTGQLGGGGSAPEWQTSSPPVHWVAMGASTGGPLAIQSILTGLASRPGGFPLPLLVVQHIAAGFLPGLAKWLTESTGFPVRIAVDGERALPGQAYLAPDDCHLGLGISERIALSHEDPENGLRPAVSHLFRSVASVCGSRAAGVLLTGMGRDGADELKMLRDAGAVTVAQDAASSVVHGMPGAAIRMGAARHVLSLDKIPALLAGLAARVSPPSVRDRTEKERNY